MMKGLISAGGIGLEKNRLSSICEDMDIIVAADSGVKHLLECECRIDYLVGDMDSIDMSILDRKIGVDTEIVRYPVEKDKTDTELAADLLIEKGCNQILIVGATGSRMDHALANIQLLRSLHLEGVSAIIIDNYNEISYLPPEIRLKKKSGYFYSILPICQEGVKVTLGGFHYPLTNTIITYGSSLGISNYLEGEEGIIIRHEGEGFLIKSKD
ncbi:MAG: thiamine diphosphokinase [Bacillota bacterium]